MSRTFERAANIFHQEGLIALLRRSLLHIYQLVLLDPYTKYLRQKLPNRLVKYNNVQTTAAHLGDSVIPGLPTDRPEYESGLVSAIDREVQRGDDVVIVGGGWGVTAVKAARKVGDSGTVTVFEGSAKAVRRVNKTIQLNQVDAIVDVNHCIVGEFISLRGDPEEANQISPSELPECDVLELDCEGSEIEILREMKISPRLVIVETHGMNNSPTNEVRKLLESKSYNVISKVIADIGQRRTCEMHDIFVLTAVEREYTLYRFY